MSFFYSNVSFNLRWPDLPPPFLASAVFYGVYELSLTITICSSSLVWFSVLRELVNQ